MDNKLRLFDGRLEPDRGGQPGEVVEILDGRLLVAARGGCLSLGRVRIGKGKKQPAAEAGLERGDRLT